MGCAKASPERRADLLARSEAELEAAASSHSLLLLRPTEAGKLMLARRLTTILPAMTLAEAIETTRIHRVASFTEGFTTGNSRMPSLPAACPANRYLISVPSSSGHC
jgi:predicted ATPase with chaperone activity